MGYAGKKRDSQRSVCQTDGNRAATGTKWIGLNTQMHNHCHRSQLISILQNYSTSLSRIATRVGVRPCPWAMMKS